MTHHKSHERNRVISENVSGEAVLNRVVTELLFEDVHLH